MSQPIMPDLCGPGQRSVWDFPRPAVAERVTRHIRIIHSGVVVADTRTAFRTLETSHPPSYYIPPQDIAAGVLDRADGTSFCEWKGHAIYYDVVVAGERLERAGWSYPAPTAPFADLRDHVAFYADRFDACFVDGEKVVSQPGGFYGGWITSDLAGPFKGVPGSRWW
jgi:uncharacterized protein (DUF427 family)